MRTRTLAVALLIAAASLTAPSCTRDNSTRSARLLTMAAEEAGFIDSIQDRLTRQLNIADLQIQTGQKSEALKTLDLAGKTLKVEEKDKKTLDDFRRIAGWTSVAELAHSAGDDKVALDAYYAAVEQLNSVEPVTRRAEYVLSISEISFTLKGKTEAGQLLVKGGQWASNIKDERVRRYALSTFTNQLISYDDLDSARTVMRNEPDAAWRADTLAMMARSAINLDRPSDRVFAQLRNAPSPAAAMSADAQVAAEQRNSEVNFNKDVHYSTNFRQQKIQQGYLPNQ